MVPGPVQAAATVALGDDVHVDDQRERYAERMAFFRDVLAGVGAAAEPSAGSFYLWAAAPAGDAWALTAWLAKWGGVLVAPGDLYGAAGEGHVRVALVQPMDRLRLVADRLRQAPEGAPSPNLTGGRGIVVRPGGRAVGLANRTVSRARHPDSRGVHVGHGHRRVGWCRARRDPAGVRPTRELRLPTATGVTEADNLWGGVAGDEPHPPQAPSPAVPPWAGSGPPDTPAGDDVSDREAELAGRLRSLAASPGDAESLRRGLLWVAGEVQACGRAVSPGHRAHRRARPPPGRGGGPRAGPGPGQRRTRQLPPGVRLAVGRGPGPQRRPHPGHQPVRGDDRRAVRIPPAGGGAHRPPGSGCLGRRAGRARPLRGGRGGRGRLRRRGSGRACAAPCWRTRSSGCATSSSGSPTSSSPASRKPSTTSPGAPARWRARCSSCAATSTGWRAR